MAVAVFSHRMVSDSFPFGFSTRCTWLGITTQAYRSYSCRALSPCPLAMEQRFRKYVRYARIGQPAWSRIEAIQLSILQQEDPARIRIAREQLWCGPRKS